LLNAFGIIGIAPTEIRTGKLPLLLFSSVVSNTFKSISLADYKLHYQIVFQLLFSITLEK